MFVARSQKHASVEFCFGSRGANPPVQVPYLRDGCLSPTHPTLTMPLIPAMAQTEQVFWQQGRLKAAVSYV